MAQMQAVPPPLKRKEEYTDMVNEFISKLGKQENTVNSLCPSMTSKVEMTEIIKSKHT